MRLRQVAAVTIALVICEAHAGIVGIDVRRAGRALEIHSSLTAEAGAATCYAVLADFDRLAEYVPDMSSSKVVTAPGEPIKLRQTGVARAGWFSRALDVTLAVQVDPPRRIVFSRVAGDIEQMSGSWTITGDEHRCTVTYHAVVQPGFWVPPLLGPPLMRGKVEDQLQGLLEEIQRRASLRQSGRPPLPPGPAP